MTYEIMLTARARDDLRHFKAYEQRIIRAAISVYLQQAAEDESNHRRQLRPNELAPWELKIDL